MNYKELALDAIRTLSAVYATCDDESKECRDRCDTAKEIIQKFLDRHEEGKQK